MISSERYPHNMDSAANRALVGFLIHIQRVFDAAGSDGTTKPSSCTHLVVPIRPTLAVLFMLVAAFLDVESILLIVISMCIMLLDFLQAWPFNSKSKHLAAQSPSVTSILNPMPEERAVEDWNIHLEPETAALDEILVDSCTNVFGPMLPRSSTGPTCRTISIGPALIGPAHKAGRFTGRVGDAVARITDAAIPGAKVYGFERTRASPGYPGGTMEIVVVVPCKKLVERLGERLQRGMKGEQMLLSCSQLHKSALRYLIDHLVHEGFKFRCSAFKAQEPTVAISAPHAVCAGQGVYVSLSVNNPLPFLEASLVREASVSDDRAVPLIATVQKWADARGLAHPVFGPLSMYGWVHTCLFFLTQVEQPRMAALDKHPQGKGFLEPSQGHRPVDPITMENFFDFCAKFPYGRHHMWLREKCIGADVPFIEDALRPGIDLGYHLQHRVPRKQLQGEAALAAAALKCRSVDIDSLAELGPLKPRTGPRNSLYQQWENPACTELRMMKNTRTTGMHGSFEVPELPDEPPSPPGHGCPLMALVHEPETPEAPPPSSLPPWRA